MALNESKTNAMFCNSRIKWDLVRELSLNGKVNIDIVDEIKIVAFLMRSDMKTISNTRYLTNKAYKKHCQVEVQKEYF